MRIQFIDMIKHASGKLNKKSDIYFRTFRKSGRNFATERKEGYQDSRTPEQAAMRQAFGERSREAKLWVDANRNPPTEAYLRIEKEYNSQLKYNSINDYIANVYLLQDLPLP